MGTPSACIFRAFYTDCFKRLMLKAIKTHQQKIIERKQKKKEN